MYLIKDILEFFKKIFLMIKNNVEIAKLNLRIIKLSKKKNIAFKDLGIIVYEFYNIDKDFLDDDEIKDLIMEIKDYEIEIDELESQIEQIKNHVREREEISNELLLNLKEKEEDKSNEQEDNKSS